MNPARRGALALLLEVASTPTIGNVDRNHDLSELRFEHFLAGAIGALPGLSKAESGGPIGDAFEEAVSGMADQRGGNTQFGALLLLVPLVRAATAGALSRDGVTAIVDETTVADSVGFYRAFDHVDVFVDDVPSNVDPDFDVRRGGEAVSAIEARSTSLLEIMEFAAGKDDVAREWVNGFPRSFETAAMIRDGSGSLLDRGARAHLHLLADRPDTFIVKEHGSEIARAVQQSAIEHLNRDDGPGRIDTTADELVAAGINPGTTADILAAGFFIALDAGESV